MVPAIEAALAAPATPDRTRIVVLISDGYIANEADVMRAIVGKLGAARLYAAGVGGSVNRFLLDRAAEIGRGRAIQVALSDAPGAAAARLAQLVDRPVLTDVEVDWGGLDVSDVYPRHLPDLFAGAPLVVHGRFARGGKATVRVRGSVGGHRYERAIDVALPEAGAADATHEVQRSLWAEAAVADRTSRLALREDPELAAEIEQLGLRYHLVTPFTSLVAVEDVAAAPPPLPTVSPGRALPGDPEIRIPASWSAGAARGGGCVSPTDFRATTSPRCCRPATARCGSARAPASRASSGDRTHAKARESLAAVGGTGERAGDTRAAGSAVRTVPFGDRAARSSVDGLHRGASFTDREAGPGGAVAIAPAMPVRRRHFVADRVPFRVAAVIGQADRIAARGVARSTRPGASRALAD